MNGSIARTRKTRPAIAVLALLVVFSTTVAPAEAKNDPLRSRTTRLASDITALDETQTESAPVETQGTSLAVARAVGLTDHTGVPLTDATGSGVQIALIDTGVVDVPGLRNSNVYVGPDFSFEDVDPELRARDTNGHGTHMAGIMVASDEAWQTGDPIRSDERLLGVAPDAELVSIKVGTADGTVDVTQVIAAINWVIRHHDDPGMNIRVLAIAYGNDSTLTDYQDPLAYAVERAWLAGIVVVAAAGNLGNDTWQLRNPARDPFVIAVGAAEMQEDGTYGVSGFSNDGYGYRSVDLVAPGRSILGLRVPGSYSDGFNEAGRVGVDRVKGTGSSQSTAVVAGAVALLLEARPDLTPDEVKATLMASATPVTGDKSLEGEGMINVQGAIATTARGSTTQRHILSIGDGDLDQARGSWGMSINGIPLEGNVDIFGNDFSASSWTEDAWSGNSWSGNSWSGNSWSGDSWSGNSWSGNSWSGNSWSGNSWSGNSWSGNSWSGNSWSGNSWSGNSWSGNSWSGNSWSNDNWN